MSNVPYHFLGADADEDENDDRPVIKAERIPLDYADDGMAAPKLSMDEVLEAAMSGNGEPVSIPFGMLSNEAIDALIQQGMFPANIREIMAGTETEPRDYVPENAGLPPRRDAIPFPSAVASLLEQLISRDEPGMMMGGGAEAPSSSGNPKDALGDLKPDLSLVPPAASIYTALAFADGARKYGPYNWRENAVRVRVYLAAALRHINQVLDGEWIDPLSGKPHIGHALASLSIIADAYETGNLIDDRPPPGAAGSLIRELTEKK